MLSLAPTGPPDMARPASPGRAGPPAAPGSGFAWLLTDEPPPPAPEEIETGPEQEMEVAMPPEEGAPDRPGSVPVLSPGRGSGPVAVSPAEGQAAGTRPATPFEGGDKGAGGHSAGGGGAAMASGGAVVLLGEAAPQALSQGPPGLLPAMEGAPTSEAVPVAAGAPERIDGANRAERRAVIPPPPPSLTRQMAAAIHAAPEGQVTVRLLPEELGQVTLQLRGEGDRIILSVAAEQADTAELIRRHQQELAQAFRALGYRSVTLSFEAGQGGGQGGRDGQGGPGAPPADPAPEAAIAEVAAAAAPHPSRSALDLRL